MFRLTPRTVTASRGCRLRLCVHQAFDGSSEAALPPAPPSYSVPARKGIRRRPREQELATKEIVKLGKQNNWQEALMILSTVPEPDVYLSTAALSACARSRQVYQARRIFEEMPEKTVWTYNIMMHLLGRVSLGNEAVKLMEEMKSQQIKPNEGSYTTIINSHGVLKDSESAFRVLDELIAAGITPSSSTCGVAMAACGRAGDVQRARDLFSKLDEYGVIPDTGQYTSLITAHVRAGDHRGARDALEEMKRKGLRPNVVTYTCLLAGVAGAEALGKAESIFEEMREEKLQPDTLAYNTLLSAAVQSQASTRFWQILEQMDREEVPRNEHTEQRIADCQAMLPLQDPVQPEAEQLPLPAGWRETLDPASGRFYYWAENDPAGTTTWVRPS